MFFNDFLALDTSYEFFDLIFGISAKHYTIFMCLLYNLVIFRKSEKVPSARESDFRLPIGLPTAPSGPPQNSDPKYIRIAYDRMYLCLPAKPCIYIADFGTN